MHQMEHDLLCISSVVKHNAEHTEVAAVSDCLAQCILTRLDETALGVFKMML